MTASERRDLKLKRTTRLALLVAGAGLLRALPTAPPPPPVAALALLVTLLGMPAVLGWGFWAWWRQAADTPLSRRLAKVALGVICRWSLLAGALAGLDHSAEAVEPVLTRVGDSLLLLTALAAIILGALFHLVSRLTPDSTAR